MSKIKHKPNFSSIYYSPLEVKENKAILSRYSNNGTHIVREHFILAERLGEGSFGKVYCSLGVEQKDENGNLIVDKTGQPILKKRTRGGGFERVIKVFPSAEEIFKKKVKNSYKLSDNEIENLWQEHKEKFIIKHEEEIKTYAANAYENGELASKTLTKDPQTGKYYLTMHRLKGLDIEKYLKVNQYLRPQKEIKIGLNIAIELERIGKLKVVHNDFKPLNLIIDPDSYRVRSVDFDASKKITSGKKDVESESGSLYYLAPERFGDNARSTKKSDVFSATASIIDAMTNYAYLNLYNSYSNIAKKMPHFKQNDFDFWYYGDPKLGQQYQNFLEIPLSTASYHRMQALKAKVSHPDYLLSEQTKNEFLYLCARGLSVDPQLRPKPSELTAAFKKIQIEFEHTLEKKRLNSLKESAKENLIDYLVNKDLIVLWKNFKAIDDLFKEFLEKIERCKTSREIEQLIRDTMDDIQSIEMLNVFQSLDKTTPMSQKTESAYVKISGQYESYKNTLDKAHQFCVSTVMHYAKRQDKVKKQYEIVKKEINFEHENVSNFLKGRTRNYFLNVSKNKPQLFDEDKFLIDFQTKLESSSKNCQMSYKKHIVDNSECAKTGRDKAIIKLGVFILNGLACISGAAFLATTGSYIYNKLKKKENNTIQTLIQPFASAHHQQIKSKYNEFSNLFKPSKQTIENTSKEEQQQQTFSVSKKKGG